MDDRRNGNDPTAEPSTQPAIAQQRDELVHRLEEWLDTPMLILAFVWLGLLIVEVSWGESLLFDVIGAVIWIIFIADFSIEFAIASEKTAFLKRNWLTGISLLVPALRIFRLLRLLPAARAGRLLLLASSLNRSTKALGATLRRRGFAYMVALTVLVTFAGAAGMYAFEQNAPRGFTSYGDALWWTAMIMTTMGSQYWPQTVEGRILCVTLAVYAFVVFGYVTATLASHFIGRDAENPESATAGADQIDALRNDLGSLRDEIRAMRAEVDDGRRHPR